MRRISNLFTSNQTTLAVATLVALASMGASLSQDFYELTKTQVDLSEFGAELKAQIQQKNVQISDRELAAITRQMRQAVAGSSSRQVVIEWCNQARCITVICIDCRIPD